MYLFSVVINFPSDGAALISLALILPENFSIGDFFYPVFIVVFMFMLLAVDAPPFVHCVLQPPQ